MSTVVHLYTICWNEEELLPHFFKYYDDVVDHYVFYDDGSTDRTLEILAQHPKVEVRSLLRDGQDSFILAAKEVHNTSWKETCGLVDWYIYTAVDEFLYAPQGLKKYLDECKAKGVTAIPALGYQMVSDTFPHEGESLFSQVKSGCPWDKMNKLSIFNPNELTPNFLEGRHTAEPKGNVVYPSKDVLLNLHHKYLGFEKTFQRHTELETKLGRIDKENGWGHRYSWTLEKFKEDWDFFKNHAHENIFAHNYFPEVRHSSLQERWWRKSESKSKFSIRALLWKKKTV